MIDERVVIMNSKTNTLLVVLCLHSLALYCCSAQDLSAFATKVPWFQGLFTKLSPDTPGFLAKGELRICDSAGTARQILPLDLAVSTNCLRWKIDIMRIWPLPPQGKSIAKLAHMDQMVLLARFDGKRTYLVYPGIHAYTIIPIPDAALAKFIADKNTINLQKTELAREIVANHPCIKMRIVSSETNHEDGFIWCAADLSRFPVQMELHVKNGVMKFGFSNVQIQTPAASLFEVPSNYVAFASESDLMNYATSNSLPNTRLFAAARTNNLGELKLALANGAEVNAMDENGATALLYAIASGSTSAANT